MVFFEIFNSELQKELFSNQPKIGIVNYLFVKDFVKYGKEAISFGSILFTIIYDDNMICLFRYCSHEIRESLYHSFKEIVHIHLV